MRRTGFLALLLALGGCSDAMRHGSLFVADVHPDEPAARTEEPAPPPKAEPPARTREAVTTAAPASATAAEPSSFTYRYYPAVFVYMDPARKLYFFPENKKWKTALKIPARFKLKTRKYVTLTLDTPKPFTLNKAHRLKYPPPPKPKPKVVAPAPVSATTAQAPETGAAPAVHEAAATGPAAAPSATAQP